MGLFGDLFSKKAAVSSKADAPATSPAAAERTYFFICSGNASLIDAHDSLLKPGLVPWSGEAAHYVFGSGVLEARAQQAQSEGLAFGGRRYMGSSESAVDTVAEALRDIRAGSYGDTHVAYAAVGGGGADWVLTVYNELLKEATSQGILPYYLYVTKDAAAARFLCDSFTRVA
jgi:hypothetical protein